jgi:serine protease AprX
MNVQLRKTIPLAALLVVASGLPVQARADDAAPSPIITVAGGHHGIAFPGGQPFHTTANPILQPKSIAVPGTAIAVATWQEQQPGGGLSNHYAIALDGVKVNTVRTTNYEIGLRYATFEPTLDEPPVAANLDTPAGNTLYMVQFVTVPLEAYQNAVQATGAAIQGYLPDETHIVSMTQAQLAQVQALPYVRWVGAYKPAYKLDESVLAWIAGSVGDAPQRFSMEVFTDKIEAQNSLAAKILAMGGTVHLTSPGGQRMEATLSPEQVVTLAKASELAFLDPWGGPGGHDMNIIRQVGGAVPLLSGLNILGQGVRGEAFDTGVQTNHPHWNGQLPILRKNQNVVDGHGTSCYGINFATSVAGNATGMVPQREQGIFSWLNISTQFGGSFTRLSLNTEAVDPQGTIRSVYQTSSVGSAQTPSYTTISQEVDDYLFKVDYLSCQSQSNLNSTSSRPQAWAKNIVSVGGVLMGETVAFGNDTPSGASFGPAQDQRVKPDLCHSYGDINTSTSGNGTTQFGGTSGATPITAGHFGLLHQMWHLGVWPGFGGKATVFDSRPFSTTAKALMINGAYRYPLTQLNRARQGWGVAQLNYLYNLKDLTFIIDANTPLLPLETHTYQVEVPAGSTADFRATMIYIDPAPTTTAGKNRVNNLSLKITNPAGTVYWGNVGIGTGGTGNYSTAGGAENDIDTVENVFLQNPVAGLWTIEVLGSSIVKDGDLSTTALDARYSLVVTGAKESAASCYADCDASGTLSIDDFICFQTQYALGDPAADCDQSGTLNTDDFICFQTSFALGC